MTIESILQSKGRAVVTLAADARVTEAVATLTRERIGAAPVMLDGAVAGVFSERDVVQGLRDHGAAALEQPVSALMTAPAVTVTRDFSVIGALALMTERRIRHLPVLEAGQLLGVVSIGDLVKHRIQLIEAEASALRDYIQTA